MLLGSWYLGTVARRIGPVHSVLLPFLALVSLPAGSQEVCLDKYHSTVLPLFNQNIKNCRFF
jgi:hypothetical protein